MRQRPNGFTQFVRKLDGVKDNDDVSSTHVLGSELPSWTHILLQFLRAEVDWSTYMHEIDRRISSRDREKRQALYTAREAMAGVGIHVDPVGLHVTNPSAYREAIEYLRSHPACQRQDDNAFYATETSAGDRTRDYDPEYVRCIWRGFT